MYRTNDSIGPYQLIRKLGQGAFGVVWLAEKQTAIAKRQVAVKLPLLDDADSSAVRQEAELWVAASGHPNVLTIFEADIYDGQVVIVSEYAPDGSLQDLVARQGDKPVSLETAVTLLSGILAGLEHLHKRGIVHRDVKPSNVLLQGDTPRLADFGIARLIEATKHSTTTMGTPVYMAPEAFDGKRSAQTDLWSAGVILYRLLAGHLPFEQQDPVALMRLIQTTDPGPLPTMLPEPLRKAIAQSLARDPSRRFRAAVEMRTALLNAWRRVDAKEREAEHRVGVSLPSGGRARAYITAGGFLYEDPSFGSVKRKYLLGTEVEVLDSDGGWSSVRHRDGTTGWIQKNCLSLSDPRTFFEVRGRNLTGYLIERTFSGGPADNIGSISIRDPVLGVVCIQTQKISEVVFDKSDRDSPLIVATLEGEKYSGKPAATIVLVLGEAQSLLNEADKVALERRLEPPSATSRTENTAHGRLKLFLSLDAPAARQPSSAGRQSLLDGVREAVTTRLTAVGYIVTSPAEPDYDFLVELRYVMTGFGDIGHELLVTPRAGEPVLWSEGVSFLSNNRLYDFPYIAPLITSALTADPAPLISLLQGDDATARSAAPHMLGRFTQRKVVEALLHAMLNADGTTASNSASALAGILGRSDEDSIRRPVLANLGDPQWIRLVSGLDRFLSALGSRYPDSRRGAAWILGEVGNPRAEAKLTSLAETDPEPSVRGVAREALERITKRIEK